MHDRTDAVVGEETLKANGLPETGRFVVTSCSVIYSVCSNEDGAVNINESCVPEACDTSVGVPAPEEYVGMLKSEISPSETPT